MDKKISVIIPTYNEGEYIKKLISTVLSANNVAELILVDDQSKPEFSKMYDTIPGIVLVHKEKNGGKDNAILTGIKKAKSEYMLILDADLQNVRKEQIEYLSKYIGNKDVVAILRGVDKAWARAIGNTYLTLGEHLITKNIFLKYKDRLFDGKSWSFDNELNNIILELPRDSAKYVELQGVSHLMKSEKHPFLEGLKEDLEMLYKVHIKRYKIYKAIIFLNRIQPYLKEMDRI